MPELHSIKATITLKYKNIKLGWVTAGFDAQIETVRKVDQTQYRRGI